MARKSLQKILEMSRGSWFATDKYIRLEIRRVHDVAQLLITTGLIDKDHGRSLYLSRINQRSENVLPDSTETLL